MSYKRQEFSSLANFMPANCLEDVLEYIFQYKIHLKITPTRSTILGNYSFNQLTNKHTITVNGTLNKYSFLVTLLHEIAHCICFVQHKNNVAPHGKHWQNIFSGLLQQFIAKNIFPLDIVTALNKNIYSPKASSCSDANLQKVLELYDTPKNNDNEMYVEQIPENNLFITSKGIIFKKLQKRRTRYLCEQINTNQQFLFPALFKVKLYNHATS